MTRYVYRGVPHGGHSPRARALENAFCKAIDIICDDSAEDSPLRRHLEQFELLQVFRRMHRTLDHAGIRPWPPYWPAYDEAEP